MYIELQDSRTYTVTTDNIQQEFIYKICDWTPPADQEQHDTDWGAFFAPNDDVVIAMFVYSTFPMYRYFPINSSGDYVILYMTSHTGKEDSDGSWIITLQYTLPPPPESVGYVQFSIQVGGDTQHILQSKEVRYSSARTGSSLSVPDVKNCIGLTKNSIEGADIPARGMRFSLTTYLDSSLWDTSLLATWYSLPGNYNDDTFYGFAAGEVLLLGISAQGEVYGLVPVTFDFKASPNANGVTDTPFPALYALGHDIIDYLYMASTDANYPIQIPTFRIVHRVGDPIDFTILGV